MAIDQKIVIVTHETFYGVPHALRDYLLEKKIDNLIFIGLPFIEQKFFTLQKYKKGKLVFEKKINQKISGIAGYVLDFLLTFYWVIKQKDRYDRLIAIDVLNASSALFLKGIGKVKKVVFYAVDFTPVRFQSPLLNYIYHRLEQFCVKHADELWSVSPMIAEGRERFLHIDPKKYPQKVVNSGIWIKKITQFPFNRVKKHQLLFLGHVLKKQGLQMVLEAIPIITKHISDFKFVILGGGEYENSLRELAKKLKVTHYVEFKGWIKDRKIIDSTLGESAAAIVVYVPEKEKMYNFSYYGDPIKIKEYLASGLPVILTDVPYNAKEIAEKKCGILVNYNKKEIADAVIFLLSNEQTLKRYRENAVQYAQKYDWMNIYNNVFLKQQSNI